jgi:hypothetical protein
MTRIKLVLVVSFLLTFAAGLTVGLVANHIMPQQRRGGPPRVNEELNLGLTDTQRKAMDSIWEQVVGSKMRQWGEQRDVARQERDQAVNALLTDDLRKKYDAVMTDFSKKEADQRDALRTERQKALAAVFPADVAPKYEAAQAEFARKDTELSDQRRLAFEEAVRQTRAILSAEQVVKYDAWIEKQRDRGFGPPMGGRPSRPAGTGSSGEGRHGPPPSEGAPPPPRGGE